MPSDRTSFSAEDVYRRRLALVNAGLDSVLPNPAVEPRRLHEAMRHGVFAGGGGKRLRPVILLSVAADLGIKEDKALPAALALELVHNYSLVHDDLPCMDDAETRRGAPPVHAAYSYAEAVLAGDALLTLAFEVLGRAANSGLARGGDLAVELARAAGSLGMVGGQEADLDGTAEAAARLPGTEHPILRLHHLKTAKLFGFAFGAPGCLGGPDAGRALAGRPLSGQAFSGETGGQDTADLLRRAGESFGLAFQVADDIRDAGEDDRAPNFARAVGAAKAKELALGLARSAVETLERVLGGEAEVIRLVRGAVREMGLGML